MRSFKGSLKIAATADVVPAEFAVDEETLEVTTGGERLGAWALTDLDMDDLGTEIRLVLDGEDVVVNVTDHNSFVAAIVPPTKRRRRRAAKKSKDTAAKQPTARATMRQTAPTVKKPSERKERPKRDVLGAIGSLFMRETWQEWLSSRRVKWSIASFAVIGVALLALFATNSLGVILLLIGMFLLVIAGLAVSEDLTAVAWIPAAISETTLVIAGVVAMVLGGLLTVVG